jgi:hypothetical protein
MVKGIQNVKESQKRIGLGEEPVYTEGKTRISMVM